MLIILVGFAFQVACTKKETTVETHFLEIQDFNAYVDPATLPEVVQETSKAVVRIGDMISGPMGTGFFVSRDGILMTNEHVLGGRNCVQTGCYITLDFDYQRSIPHDKTNSKRLFAKPMFADKSLDVALFKIYDTDGNEFHPEHVAEIENRSSKSLVNSNVTVIGHPMAGLKKAKTANVMSLEADFLILDEYYFRGNSGSPIINSRGKVVGIIHRSGNDIGGISRDGIESQSIGTSSENILNAISPQTRKVQDTLKNDEKIKKIFKDIDSPSYSLEFNPNLVLAAQRLPNKKKTANNTDEEDDPIKALMDGQGERCDGLINTSGLSTNYWNFNWDVRTCLRNTFFINCSDKRGKLQTCPSLIKQEQWVSRSESILDHSLNNFSELNSSALNLMFSVSKEKRGGFSHQSWFRKYMKKAQPVLNFKLVRDIYSAGLQDEYSSYDGKNLNDFITNYKKYKFHHKELFSIMGAHFDRLQSMPKTKIGTESKRIQQLVTYAFAHRNLTMREKVNFEINVYEMKFLKFK